MIERKWKFDTIYSKELSNYMEEQKAKFDTSRNQLVKETSKRGVDNAFKQILETTLEFREDSLMEEDFFIMGHPRPVHARWYILDDRKIVLNIPPQKGDTIKIKDSIRIKDTINYITRVITLTPNAGEKDTFNIVEITNDRLVLAGKAQSIGNGTIVLKAIK